MVPLGNSFVGSINPITVFDVSLSYVLFNTARLDVGYQNVTPELLDNMGKRNSVFYSIGGSELYANVSLYIDTLIDKAIGVRDPKQVPQEGRGGRATP